MQNGQLEAKQNLTLPGTTKGEKSDSRPKTEQNGNDVAKASNGFGQGGSKNDQDPLQSAETNQVDGLQPKFDHQNKFLTGNKRLFN